jgi:integrase
MKRNRNPRFLKQYRDAAGNVVNQYRRAGKLVRLPNGRDFNDAFWTAYYAAEAEITTGAARQQIGAARTRLGSIDAALVGFYKSTDFTGLAPNSRRSIRQALERDFRAWKPGFGNALLTHLKTAHLKELIADKAAKSPSSARLLRAAIRKFTEYCVAVELLKENPALGIKPLKNNSAGHHTWTEDEIARFERCHKAGSLARLAFGLHVYTGQRTGDVMRMGRQHLREVRAPGPIRNVISITQQKTGTPVAVPVHPELQQLLDRLPRTAGLGFLCPWQTLRSERLQRVVACMGL